MTPTATIVADWIRGEMEAEGIIQDDIQKRLGNRSHGYVSERVSGKRSWGISELDAIAPLFHCANALDVIERAAGKGNAASGREQQW